MIGLLAVVLAYNAFRPNYESTKTTSQETVGGEKKAGGNVGKATSPRSARQKASEADWAAVHAIAQEYAPQLAELERQRNEFKDVLDQFSPDEFGYADIQGDEFEPLGIDPNLEWLDKEEAVSKGVYNTEKAIRDMEREQWSRMSEHLSPYELRQYRMEHSWRGRMIQKKAAWMDPPLNEGELLALFVREDGIDDFLDREFDGNRREMNSTLLKAHEKRIAILDQHHGKKTPAEVIAMVDALSDPEVLLYNEHQEIRRNAPPISRKRDIQYFFGPQRKAVAEAELELERVMEMKANGQATAEELNAAQLRAVEIETEDEFVADE